MMEPSADDDQSEQPTMEVIERNGEPIWRICQDGICVEEHSGIRARAVLERIRSGEERTYSLDEVVADLGLDASDL
jgi:hypothetical protein